MIAIVLHLFFFVDAVLPSREETTVVHELQQNTHNTAQHSTAVQSEQSRVVTIDRYVGRHQASLKFNPFYMLQFPL